MLRYAFDLVKVISGSLCIAAGIALFLAPNDVTPGGFAGLSLLLEHTTGIPLGLTLVAANGVLLLLGARALGQARFVAKTIVGILTLAIGVEVFDGRWPSPTAEPLLLAIYGGLLDGFGIALAFRGGGTTGGVDILARLVSRRFGTPPGVVMLSLNIVVYSLAAATFGVEQAMLALLVSFVSARTLDAVTQGLVATRTVLIVSPHARAISDDIVHDLGYGVTVLEGVGGFSGEPQHVLFVVIPRADTVRLRRRVIEIDPGAFLTFLPSRGVVGGHAVPADP